ncbi:thiamine-phosphate diphosphorylase [Methanomicrobiaceae archaeon CYW5]|uniref:thiamine phosphate synthase n=1 Tax=Methanovulcanius yangii TaxID=1789227 RepID=UPI0029CA511C|nr:thiamine phosphate synthase [Methanovulcanius yangii]MBT8508730.1 thiamine-phosphate diphosphorylase [Methanovulcanius yangii]
MPADGTAIPALYVVTDPALGKGRSHAEQAAAAVAGGAGIIQLRDKHLEGDALLAEALAVREALAGTDTIFVVNDSLDAALAAGAHGVHLGQDDGSVPAARAAAKAAGRADFLIGVSVGSVVEACRAVDEGADYVALGPVFPTGSKADAGPARGLALLSAIRGAVPVPLVAIGGITTANVASVIRAGADSAAVISAVIAAEDVTVAAREMASEIEGARALR